MFVLFFLESKSLKKVQNSFYFLHELNSPSPWLHPTKSANVEKKQTKTYFWKRRKTKSILKEAVYEKGGNIEWEKIEFVLERSFGFRNYFEHPSVEVESHW